MQIVGVGQHEILVAASSVNQNNRCAVGAGNEPTGQLQTIPTLKPHILERQFVILWSVRRLLLDWVDEFLRCIPTDCEHNGYANTDNNCSCPVTSAFPSHHLLLSVRGYLAPEVLLSTSLRTLFDLQGQEKLHQ